MTPSNKNQLGECCEKCILKGSLGLMCKHWNCPCHSSKGEKREPILSTGTAEASARMAEILHSPTAESVPDIQTVIDDLGNGVIWEAVRFVKKEITYEAMREFMDIHGTEAKENIFALLKSAEERGREEGIGDRWKMSLNDVYEAGKAAMRDEVIAIVESIHDLSQNTGHRTALNALITLLRSLPPTK